MARFAMRPAYVGATPARTGGPGTIDYLFAPESTRVWLTHFLLDADRDRVRFTGEGAQTTCDIDDIAGGTSDGVVLYSSHETLTRDLAIARVLRERGVRVFCQTPRAARLGTDKYAMKSFFDESGFDTSPWICGDAQWPGSDEDLLVVKHRHGTQSQGIGLRRADDCALGPDQFAELYRDGVEYSVVVYRDDDRCVLFPPVWKGPTSTELRPPWRRLRLCPHTGTNPARATALTGLSRRIADAIDCVGPLEIEYLVTDDAILVLEINPRISGTMRISALAAGIPIFSLPTLPELDGAQPAVRFAGEAPYSGTPFVDAEAGVFATSRLTVVADSTADLRARFAGAVGSGEPFPFE